MIEKMKTKTFVQVTLIILVFVLLSLPRLTRLTADPPPDLSWSAGYYGDEAGYAHNARNKALFGRWVLDEYNPFFVNPVLTFFDYLSFKTFRPSILSLRLVAVFWGILGMFLLFYILKHGGANDWMPWIGVILLESNYFYLMYTRLSLSDTMLTNWMLLSVFLWVIGFRRKRYMFLAGLSSVVVLSCKPTAVYFAFVLMLAYPFHFMKDAWENVPGIFLTWKIALRDAAFKSSPFLGGFLLGFSLWLGLYYIPYHAEFAKMSSGWSFLSLPKSFGDFLNREFGSYSPIIFKHFAWFPYIFLLSWFYLPISFFRLFRDWKRYNTLEFLALFWLVFGYLSLSGFRYRPARYYLSLVPPVLILSLFAMEAIIKFSWNRLKLNKISIILFLSWLLLSLMLIKKYIIFDGFGVLLSGSGVFLLALAVLMWIGRKSLVWDQKSFNKIGLYACLLILSVSLSHNLFLYANWVRHPSYQVLNASRDVGNRVKNGIIVGLWAPMICMENQNRALCVASRWFNDKDPYEKYHFTHVFLWRGNRDAELSLIRKPLGRKFIKKNLKPIARYKIKGAWGILFKVVDVPMM